MSATASKPMTKTEVISALAEATGLTKPQVNEFFDELTKLIRSKPQRRRTRYFQCARHVESESCSKRSQARA